MNASQVYDHIEKIAATSSKKEKEALIKEGGSCELFMRVLKAAYDPFAIYGIDKVPEKTPVFPLTDHTLDKDGPWVLLDHLRSRKVTGNQARDFVAQEIEALDAKSSTLFRRILKKDLRAGFTDGTVNRVFPGTFPDFPYMRCSLPAKSNMQKWSWWEPHFSQEKGRRLVRQRHARRRHGVDHDAAGHALPHRCSRRPGELADRGARARHADAWRAARLRGGQAAAA
jgi:DNA ligase-1